MINAGITCCLITPQRSFIFKIATGTILKLAAIGVKRVPQYPHVRANIPTRTGFGESKISSIEIGNDDIVVETHLNGRKSR